MTDRVCVGAIAGSYGVRGDVRLKSFCTDPGAIADYAPLETEDGKTTYTVTIKGAIKNGLAARLSGVTSKEAADALKGVRLYAPRARLPGLPDDEYYHADLINLDVLDTGGNPIGQVRAVLNHGAGDLLEIHGPGLKSTILLPFTLAAVPTVDLSAGRLIIDPPDGLLE